MDLNRVELVFVLTMGATAAVCMVSYATSWMLLRSLRSNAKFLPASSACAWMTFLFGAAYLAGASVYTNVIKIKFNDDLVLLLFWILCGICVYSATVSPWLTQLRREP